MVLCSLSHLLVRSTRPISTSLASLSPYINWSQILYWALGNKLTPEFAAISRDVIFTPRNMTSELSSGDIIYISISISI